MKDINLFGTENSIYLKKVRTKAEISGDWGGYLIEGSEKEARKIIASLKDKKFRGKVGLVGGDDAFNRRAVETLKMDYLVSPERGAKKDSLKQRDSGINHVVAKMAKEKGVAIVIDFSEVAGLKGKDKALRLERIIQNVKICRKVGCKIKIWGSEDKKALESFGVSLGMSSSQARDSTLF